MIPTALGPRYLCTDIASGSLLLTLTGAAWTHVTVGQLVISELLCPLSLGFGMEPNGELT